MSTASPGAPPENGGVRRAEVLVTGVVQGVGFRPFVHRLALREGLAGSVRNESGRVRIQVEGPAEAVARFRDALGAETPPLARIAGVAWTDGTPDGASGFRVVPSLEEADARLPAPPDVAVCDTCLAEVLDTRGRRAGYPFTTCTDCGPRFTLLRAMPFDRERTTMAAFDPCPTCAAEYVDPCDRRHHAQTNACPGCGPQAWLEMGHDRTARPEDTFRMAAALLQAGRVVAVRGVGGFHLAVDARSDVAVARLRRNKGRDAKPMAVMVRSVEEARTLAEVGAEEAALLMSPRRPIVLLPRRNGDELAVSVAPGLAEVGVMVAYTPLHHLLLEEMGRPLVMTSGNLSDEPLAVGNDEARDRLDGIADAWLLHNREIVSRCDDSVVRPAPSGPILLRRGRGWAPLPVELPVSARRTILAVGPHLKNTFTLARERDAWVSPHVGDLESVETVAAVRAMLDRYRTLYHLEPEAVVADAHPGYMSTRLAAESGLEILPPVQHHHAHVAAVAAEHGVADTVLGLAFDGTGYGDDGRIWGCEFLLADLVGYRRLGHLRYAPMPGGDRAARSPWRALLGYASLDPRRAELQRVLDARAPAEREQVAHQVARGVNAPEASSLGRLFDAAAAVLGLRTEARYEGQAAMELEARASRNAGVPLPDLDQADVDGVRVLDPLPLLAAMARSRGRHIPVADLAAGFHRSVIRGAVRLASELCEEHGVRRVVLGGGCFQNVRLLEGVDAGLRAEGLDVLVARALPPNDGGVSYGQAAVAAARLAC